VVLAQRQIPGKTNEIPMVAALVADLRAAGHDPATMVFTLDTLHTQHRTAELLDDAGAGYVLTVKANQPGLREAIIGRLRDHRADRPPVTGSVDAGTGAPNNASSRSPPPPGSPSPAPPRSSVSPATPAGWTANANAKRSCTASPT